MRFVVRLTVFAAILLAAGCSSKNKGVIEGTKWSSIGANIKGKFIPDDALRLDFRSDGGLTYQIGPNIFSGTYSLGGGDSVTFNLQQALAGSKTHREGVAINGDRMTLTDSDGTQLTFVRIGAK